MILADLSVWSAMLQGGNRSEAHFNDMLMRGELTAPGLVFAQLLGEAEDETESARLRGWATQVAAIDETRNAWIAAGDIACSLATKGLQMNLVDCYVMALAAREGWAVWSLNPRFEDVVRHFPLQRYRGA